MTGPGTGQIEGTTFGPYRLTRRLGGGGLGEVYLGVQDGAAEMSAPDATQVGTPQMAAIKLMRPPEGDPLTQGVLDQVERVAALRQPHVIPLYGAAIRQGRVGVVMAYAPGGSLADTLTRDGGHALPLPLPAPVVGRLIAQLARALAAAHAAGIAHGDVKPSNIFVRTSSRGAPVASLSDFGQGGMSALAARIIGSGSPLGREEWAQRQLLFAAPEQLRGELTPATDQYALAAVAYYLLTGRPPLLGAGEALLTRVATEEPLPVSALDPHAPERLDDIFARALAKSPEQRFPSVEVFARTLVAALSLAPIVPQGVTSAFARLGGASASTGAEGTPPEWAPGGSAEMGGLPDETSAMPWRPLALATAAALIIAMVTCALSVFALNGATAPVRTTLAGFQGPNAAPTAPLSRDLSRTPQGQAAVASLRAFTAGQPLFADPLSSNAHGWAQNGGTIYFGHDHQLHLNNQSGDTVMADAPTPPPPGDYVAQVTMRFAQGSGGDVAGMRFFVTDMGNGAQEYYAFFLSPEGEYYLWYYRGSWTFLAGGYAPEIHQGVGATNTLAVIALGDVRKAKLFVNGAYVGSATLDSSGPVNGGAGLIVLNHGVEAVYSSFALYSAHS